MNIKFNVPGQKRKELAKDIGTWLGCDVKYCGVPSCAYKVDYFTVNRDGMLTYADNADSEVIERLLQHLYDEGFEFEMPERNEPSEDDSASDGIAIQIPFSQVNVGNLTLILNAKGNLIKKALGIEDLRFSHMEDRVDFPWFPMYSEPDELKAYMHFVTALCEMSKNQKRITAKEKAVDNEKYAFRCFLLRLGFIGDEYKAERKILLRNLTGSSAFKSNQRKEDETDA